MLGWAEFVPKYLEDAGAGTARALSGITGDGSLPAATGGDRSAPPPDGSADDPFDVFAEFELNLTTTDPTAAFDLGGDAPVTVAVVRSDGAGAALGLAPMRAAVWNGRRRSPSSGTTSRPGPGSRIPTNCAGCVTSSAPVRPAGRVGPPDAVPPGRSTPPGCRPAMCCWPAAR